MWKVYVGYVVGSFFLFYAGYGLIILTTGSYEGDLFENIGATIFCALLSAIAFLFSKKMRKKYQNLKIQNKAAHSEPVLNMKNESKTTTKSSFSINDDFLTNADSKKVKIQTDQELQSIQDDVKNVKHASNYLVSENNDDTLSAEKSNELLTEMHSIKDDEALQPFNIVEK